MTGVFMIRLFKNGWASIFFSEQIPTGPDKWEINSPHYIPILSTCFHTWHSIALSKWPNIYQFFQARGAYGMGVFRGSVEQVNPLPSTPLPPNSMYAPQIHLFMYFCMYVIHSGPENLKMSRQKKSWNQIIK